MENIKCFDSKGIEKVIKPQFIETMGFKPSENVFPSDVEVIHRGETYYDGGCFFKKKKVAEHKFYKWNEFKWIFRCTAQVLVSELRENLNEYNIWKRYFDTPKQVGYNQMEDCVMRKATIIVRTVSGETLYAIFDNNEEAKNVVNEFNRL